MSDTKGRAKKIFLTILLVMFFVAGVTFFAAADIKNAKHETNVTQTVTVKDGIAVPAHVTTDIKVDKKGTYNWYTGWKESEAPGFITGMILRNEDGEQIFGASGSLANIQFYEQSLPAGTYTAEYTFLTDQEQYDAYIRQYKLKEYQGSFEDYADGTWEMRYTLGYTRSNSAAYAAGVFCGVMVVVVIFIILLYIARKAGTNASPDQYDERQLAARGIAFKYGFFTLIFGNFILMFMNVLEVELPFDQDVSYLLCVLAGVLVFMTYSVWKDAYFSLNENRRVLMVFFAVVTVINMMGGVHNFLSGSAIVDGKLTMEGSNVIVSFLFVYIFMLLLVKGIRDRQEDDE